jgi:hypothetical protein
MSGRSFSGPHGVRQPALEQNLVKHRAYQMLLALFYTEELKRQILRLNDKKSRDKTLQDLVYSQIITPPEKSEILQLVNDRNVIAHELQSLFLDLSHEAFKYGVADYMRRHRHDAVETLRRYLKRFNSIPVLGIYRLQENDLARFHFEFAERTLLAEIVRLERKIKKLAKARSVAIKAVNQEIRSLAADGFTGEMHPDHPLNRYDNGRLTQRGAEICYRLFDVGKSAIAVAHLFRMSLVAARKRQRSWLAVGGKARPKVEVPTLPKRRFYRRYDD